MCAKKKQILVGE